MSEWVDFAAIKQKAGIAQVLRRYRVRLKAVGAHHLRGGCPLPTHGSGNSRESFQVDTAKNVWSCHSASCCEARQGKVGGNVLDLVACMESCSIREAALRLKDWRESFATSERQKELASKEMTAVFGEDLPRLAPLPFSLRLWWHPYLEQRGIERPTAALFGVGYYAGSGLMQGRVAFPIQDEHGQLVGYAGRSVDGREPRYLFPPGFGKSQLVFNLHRAIGSRASWAIVVEGFFDCLKVHQAGYANVVALMGVSASARQSKLLSSHFGELVLMMDGDEAGRRASAVLAKRWPAARVHAAPWGRQPDQLSSREIEEILRVP